MASNETGKHSLEFISQWQERMAKQQRTFASVLVATLILALLIMEAGFAWYQKDNYERTILHNMNYVQDNALQETYSIEQRMEDNVRTIRKFAKQYAYLETLYPDSTVQERIQLLWDNTMFDRVLFADAEGNLTSVSGTVSMSDREYFQNAMSGGEGYQMLKKSRITGQPALMYYAPIYRGKEIIGVMVGIHERERIDHQLVYQFLNYEPNIYLLEGDGTVIGSSNDKYISENMFEILQQREFRGEVDYDHIKQVIDDDVEKTVAFTFLDEERSAIGVVAQFAEGDMMILSVLPSEITEAMISEANHAGKILMLNISLAFLALLVVFVIFLLRLRKRVNTEMTAAVRNLEESSAHDQRQSLIVESLGNTFSSVYYVELAKNRYEQIREENLGILPLVDRVGDWDKNYRTYVQKFVSPEYQERMACMMNLEECKRRLEADQKLVAEYQRPDMQWRKAMMIPTEREEDGQLKSVIFAVQKIDYEKQVELATKQALEDAYEAAKLASNAKTMFLSNISHDIRTPINAIVGMTAIAGANLNNTEKVSDCLKKINISSKHLLGIINEVLDMSKIETGKVDLSEEEFHLPDLFDELITINQPLIRERQHTLTVQVNDMEHEDVIGDSVRLQQVFTNLLTNAIKYTPNGGKLEITVSEKPTNKPNIGWYEVIFRDNGIGMSEEFQRDIFEPFSRARDSRISAIQGTGLGMPIAKNIIRMMNGDIQVESKIDEGSCFTVSFALRLQNQKAVDYASFVNLPVLVTDDDITACETTCMMLDSLSMHSEYVTSGQEAVEKVQERHERKDDYYAVIVDWQMPGMDGIETTRAIRKAVGQDTPIIVISAYDWTDIEQEARAAGVNAFLSKPLFKSRLISLFSELTGKEEKNADEGYGRIRKQNFAGKRILLAEDNELNSEIAVELLSMMELQVDVAENGKVCLEKFTASEAGYYDLIFMDIQMPVMDGYQAAAAIRVSEHPQAQTIPIYAMSANAFSTDVRNAISSGMNGHLSKPIDIDAVIKVLGETLK